MRVPCFDYMRVIAELHAPENARWSGLTLSLKSSTILFNGACAVAVALRGGGTLPRWNDGGTASNCVCSGPSGLATSGVPGDDLANTAVVGKKRLAITTRWLRNELIVGNDEQASCSVLLATCKQRREGEEGRGGPVDIWARE